MDVVGDDDRMNILCLADSAIHPQSWATIARGIYKGDGCFVVLRVVSPVVMGT